jgi:hypothetical protein
MPPAPKPSHHSHAVQPQSISAPELIPQALPFLPAGLAVRDVLAWLTESQVPFSVEFYLSGRVAAEVRPEPRCAVEVTGAGDALTGCFLAHLLTGADETEALRGAMAAAGRVIMRPGELPLTARA